MEWFFVGMGISLGVLLAPAILAVIFVGLIGVLYALHVLGDFFLKGLAAAADFFRP